MTRPLIFLSDLLHALDDLDIRSPELARAVTRMLSLESWAELAAAPQGPLNAATAAHAPPPAAPAPAVPPAPAVDAQPAAATAATPETASAAFGPAIATLVEPAPKTVEAPVWALASRAMARGGTYAGAPPEPLLDPMQDRAIHASLAAAQVDDGGIDMDRLVATLARGEPLVRLPVRRGWGLRRGVQVLVDEGPGMAPFAHDVEQVLRGLARLLPVDRIERAGFAGSPLRGVRIRRRGRSAWQPPATQTPVLVLTDLGLCRRDECPEAAGADEWLEFADAARRARVPLRTLVPYAPARWPAALGAVLRCIHWDRRTTAGTVRRALAGHPT